MVSTDAAIRLLNSTRSGATLPNDRSAGVLGPYADGNVHIGFETKRRLHFAADDLFRDLR
jgi:hypothetical protein